MNKTKNIYVVGGNLNYSDWLDFIGYSAFSTKNTDVNTELKRAKTADLIMFTGGEDVTPALYEEERGSYTHSSLKRDEYEAQFFNMAIKNNIPMIGICRGLN